MGVLWAEMEAAWAVTVVALAGGLLTAVAAFFIKVWPVIKEWKEQHAAQEQGRSEREARIRHDAHSQVVAEYAEIVKELRGGHERDRQRLETRMGELYDDIRRLQREHAECLARGERQAGQILILRAEIDSVRIRQDIAGLPTVNEAIITADQDRLVVEWNEAATLLFHWRRQEVLGREITFLIPDDFLVLHDDAWARMRQERRPPRRGPFEFVANTKDGSLMPITVHLSGWEDGGKFYVAATIRPRILPGPDAVTGLPPTAGAAAPVTGPVVNVPANIPARVTVDDKTVVDVRPRGST